MTGFWSAEQRQNCLKRYSPAVTSIWKTVGISICRRRSVRLAPHSSHREDGTFPQSTSLDQHVGNSITNCRKFSLDDSDNKEIVRRVGLSRGFPRLVRMRSSRTIAGEPHPSGVDATAAGVVCDDALGGGTASRSDAKRCEHGRK